MFQRAGLAIIGAGELAWNDATLVDATLVTEVDRAFGKGR